MCVGSYEDDIIDETGFEWAKLYVKDGCMRTVFVDTIRNNKGLNSSIHFVYLGLLCVFCILLHIYQHFFHS